MPVPWRYRTVVVLLTAAMLFWVWLASGPHQDAQGLSRRKGKNRQPC
jgi:hypothetical protein